MVIAFCRIHNRFVNYVKYFYLYIVFINLFIINIISY